MTVQAMWNDEVVAESDRTILVEGNQYFPVEDVRTELFETSESSTYCPWKGDASYYSIVVDGRRNDDAAWYYREPFDEAKDIRNYVAFWKGVEVTGSNERTPGDPTSGTLTAQREGLENRRCAQRSEPSPVGLAHSPRRLRTSASYSALHPGSARSRASVAALEGQPQDLSVSRASVGVAAVPVSA